MSLTIQTWDVHSVRPATVTRLQDGILEINVAELKALAVPPLTAIEVHIVSPGDGVRITHLLDAVVPATKVDDPEATFPGITASAVRAGDGVTNRLAGVNVLSVANFEALTAAAEVSIEGDSLIDMSGPGAEACPYSATENVVLMFRLEADADPVEADRAIRTATLAVAKRLAESSLGAGDPDHVDDVDLSPNAADLPSIAMILQVASEGPCNDSLLYGQPMVRAPARAIDPAEILDGAVVSGAYDYAGLRNVTATYQDNALIRALVTEHGSTLNFSGVVLSLAFLTDPDDKRAWAEDAAMLVDEMGADGVVITAFQSGNSQTDVMLTIQACEARGIRTVAILTETDTGLVDTVPQADALVSSGNEDELVTAWVPLALIGPGVFEDGTPADQIRSLPILAYLGAIEQTGGSLLRAEAS